MKNDNLVKRNFFLFLGSVVFALLLPIKLLGQNPSFFHYSIENVAPTNEFYCVLKDNDEYLWFGSDEGVFRYNGVQFEHFTSPELTAKSATGLLESHNGRIYGYNFNNQLFYIEGQQLHVIQEWDIPLNAITSPKKGELWISSTKGLFIMNESTFEFRRFEADHHTIQNTNGDYICKNVRSYGSGNIIYHHHDIITELKDNNINNFQLEKEFIVKHILFSFTDNQPWMIDLEAGKLFRKEKKDWKPYINVELQRLLTDKKITHVIEIDSNLWFSTYAGIIKFELSTEKSSIYFPSTSFSGCTKDFQGNYWFTTLFEGVIKVPNFNIKTWSTGQVQIIDHQFSGITVLDNRLYFSSTKGNLLTLDLNNLKISQIKHTPESDISMISVDSVERHVVFHKTAELFGLKNNRAFNMGRIGPVKSFFRDSIAGFLVSSSYGLFTFTKSERFEEEKTLITEGWFREICPIPNEKKLFIASNSGVFQIDYDQGKFKLINHTLDNIQVLSVAYNSKDKMVYGLSFDGRIFRINPTDFSVVSVYKLEKQTRAKQITCHDNFLFLATTSGVARLDLRDTTLKTINKLNGLSSNDVRQILILGNQIWAATGYGINQIPLSEFDAEIPLGKIYLSGLITEGIVNRNPSKIFLEYNQGITFLVDGLSYSSESNLKLAYKIEYYSTNWTITPFSSGRIDIPKLPSNAKSIQIKLIDHLNRNSENILHLSIEVSTVFYERWWFYLVLILTAGGFVFLMFKIRITQLRHKQRRELKQLKLENELRLTEQNALKAQMNPHFLFNVLNSIKAYIYENDKKNAARYLSDFSNLVRNVLELSSKPKVSLEKELDALKIYIDLEAMLLQDDFQYTIDVPSNIDASNLQIPALIIQPYVENAFKHGLRHQKGRKELNIAIKHIQEDQLLEVKIVDNGIGRSAANSINMSNPSHRQSFATSAIEKRIQLLNHAQKDIVGVEIIDNFEGEKSIGTTVTIRIHV